MARQQGPGDYLDLTKLLHIFQMLLSVVSFLKKITLQFIRYFVRLVKRDEERNVTAAGLPLVVPPCSSLLHLRHAS